MNEKLSAAMAACALCLGMLAGCAPSGEAAAPGTGTAADEKIEIVCTTFPAYDWARQVVGDQSDRYEISYLMGSGTDLHSYQPTVEDIARISQCDLFVYAGGESDGWVEDVLAGAENPALRTVNMLESIGGAAVEEELAEGMQAGGHDHDHDHDHDHGDADEHEHDHDHDHGDADEHGHGHEEGPEYDEHVWLSLRNAQVLVQAIADELAVIDPAQAASYAAHADAYNAELAELDARYTAAVGAAANDTVVFADRFPFRYLVEDYGLTYYAAFIGCSAETEASFETVAFLAQKLDELGLDCVLVIENSDQGIARTVIASTQAKDQQVLVMDSLQSATSSDVEGGKTYLGAMEDNLGVLTTALG